MHNNYISNGHDASYALYETENLIDELIKLAQKYQDKTTTMRFIIEEYEKHPSSKKERLYFNLMDEKLEINEQLKELKKQVAKIICFGLAARRGHIKSVDHIELAMYFNSSFCGPFHLFEPYNDSGKKNPGKISNTQKRNRKK